MGAKSAEPETPLLLPLFSTLPTNEKYPFRSTSWETSYRIFISLIKFPCNCVKSLNNAKNKAVKQLIFWKHSVGTVDPLVMKQAK